MLFKIWGQGLGAYTTSDSAFTDSLLTFRLLFTDSLSVGCLTAGGPCGADSAVSDPSILTSDTLNTMAQAWPNPVGKSLRAAATGSGKVVIARPLSAGATANNPAHTPALEVFAKAWMRIRWQAWTRNTLSGQVSTTPNRTTGIRGFTIIAYVYYANP